MGKGEGIHEEGLEALWSLGKDESVDSLDTFLKKLKFLEEPANQRKGW